MAKRITIDEVREEFAEHKLELVSDVYESTHHKLKFRCLLPEHNDKIQEISLHNLRHGGGCTLCTNMYRKSHEEFVEYYNKTCNNSKHIKIIDTFTSMGNKIKCFCVVHNVEFYAFPINLLNGASCELCKYDRRLREHIENLQQKNPNLEYLSGYKNNNNDMCLFKCKLCGCEISSKFQGICKRKCPKCNFGAKKRIVRTKYTVKVNIGEDDLWTTHPRIAELLANKEDGYTCTYGSRKKLEWVCPECGTHTIKSVNQMFRHGIACKSCFDGISFPNKLLFNILKPFNLNNFKPEKTFEWTYYLFRGKQKRGYYDFYFTVDGKGILIEADGGMHRTTTNLNDYTIEEIQYMDDKKTKLANENGFKIIRIECPDENYDAIKANILDSDLCEYIDMSKIDWDECCRKSLKSNVVLVCELWNKGYTNKQICEILSRKKTLG